MIKTPNFDSMETNMTNTNTTKRSYKHRPTKSEVLKSSKTVFKGVKREIESMDKPLTDDRMLNKFIDVISNSIIYRRKKGISSQCMDVLLVLYSCYLKSGSGVTIYGLSGIMTSISHAGVEYRNLKYKFDILEDHGFIARSGKSLGKAYLYIPTSKAIEDISRLFTV